MGPLLLVYKIWLHGFSRFNSSSPSVKAKQVKDFDLLSVALTNLMNDGNIVVCTKYIGIYN